MTPGGSSPLLLKLLVLSLLSTIVQGQSSSTVQAINNTEFHSSTYGATTTAPSTITTVTTTPSTTTMTTSTTTTPTLPSTTKTPSTTTPPSSTSSTIPSSAVNMTPSTTTTTLSTLTTAATTTVPATTTTTTLSSTSPSTSTTRSTISSTIPSTTTTTTTTTTTRTIPTTTTTLTPSSSLSTTTTTPSTTTTTSTTLTNATITTATTTTNLTPSTTSTTPSITTTTPTTITNATTTTATTTTTLTLSSTSPSTTTTRSTTFITTPSTTTTTTTTTRTTPTTTTNLTLSSTSQSTTTTRSTSSTATPSTTTTTRTTPSTITTLTPSSTSPSTTTTTPSTTTTSPSTIITATTTASATATTTTPTTTIMSSAISSNATKETTSTTNTTAATSAAATASTSTATSVTATTTTRLAISTATPAIPSTATITNATTAARTTPTTVTTTPSTATTTTTTAARTTPTTVTTTPSTATTKITTTPTTARTTRGPSILENAEGKNIYKLRDPDGNILQVYNFTGCHWTVPGADIQCAEGSYIAAIRNIFYFLNPQNISKCNLCSGLTEEGCRDTCCSRNEVNECIFYEDPTKDLITRVKSCSVKSFCPKQTYGWTSLDPGYRRCFPDIAPGSTIYSQTAELQYICVKGAWELLMTHEEPKSGSVLFLNSFRDNHFNPNKIGFNLSCTLSAEDKKTIEITALDLRLCSDFDGASNTRPCGQRMIITEPQNQSYVIGETSNDDQGYLGLKRVYLSKTNQVTIQVQSDGIESSFNVWLYVEPSGGKITGKCSAPILFTTTTTTTTTTAPSTATSKSTRRRVITSTVHVSSPSTTTGILSGTTTTADGHLGHPGGEVGGEHYVNPDDSSQLDQVLIYEKISVTGVWATFLIIFIFLIWAYRKLRAKSKQFRLGQTQSHEVPQMRNTKANVYATPPFSNSAYEPGRERISRHSYNLPQDVTRPPPLPPQQTKSRIYEKTPAPSVPTRVRAPDRPRDNTASRQSERTSSSVQGARLVLVDLVMKEVKSDPEIERALRSTSPDVRSAIEAMDTKTLRQTYDDIQKMRRDRNSTYETVHN